jgi:hypothetical protein
MYLFLLIAAGHSQAWQNGKELVNRRHVCPSDVPMLLRGKVSMNTLRHKEYAILAGAKRDSRTGKYEPLVHISWQTLGGRRKLAFSLPERCNLSRGERFGVRRSKAVDR